MMHKIRLRNGLWTFVDHLPDPDFSLKTSSILALKLMFRLPGEVIDLYNNKRENLKGPLASFNAAALPNSTLTMSEQECYTNSSDSTMYSESSSHRKE